MYKIKSNEKLKYTSKFNKKEIDSIFFNNQKIDIKSIELKIMLKNLIISICAYDIGFKYALLSKRYSNLEFSELDSYTNLKYLTSEEYFQILVSSLI